MKKVGFVGWRGMVGQVLMERLEQEGDLKQFKPFYFSTSQAGEKGPDGLTLKSAVSLADLQDMDIIVTCQGGEWTKEWHPQLRSQGWRGHWIDASSALRMDEKACLILDPVNQNVIDQFREHGCLDWVGANCTVSLMLMSIYPLLPHLEWISSMTYQAASGAGAQQMKEFMQQMSAYHQALQSADGKENFQHLTALEMEKKLRELTTTSFFPKDSLGYPLAANVLPWIDSALPSGQSREEWKAMVEAQKICGFQSPLPIDGTCVRVGAFRSHSQALTLKFKKALPLQQIEELLQDSKSPVKKWLRFVPNTKEKTLESLTPMSVAGSLDIAIGRLRPMTLGKDFVNAFTCGDQLLWGAAEPLRRMLKQLL
jgi:aspartate-semialdehyde dehydrogenase